MIDLIIGAKSGQNNNDKYIKRADWLKYDSLMEHMMEKIDMPESERIVFIPDCYGSNMSLKYGYSNIGFFSSARNRDVLKAMYKLGYNVQMEEQLWITSYSGTFVNYSMAGVKYYITDQKLEDEIYGFDLNEQFEDFYIYKNRNSFDIGFYLSDNIEESYNPFKMQNDILNAMNSEEIEYFEEIEKSSDILNCDKYLKFDNVTEEYIITYNVKAFDDCSIYLSSDYNLQVYINGETQFENYSNIWSTETGVKQIKHLTKGEVFRFTIKTKQNLDLLFVYVSNNNKIQELFNLVKNKEYIDKVIFNSNGLKGVANFERDGILCFSINYDKNWKVYVNGIETKSEKVSNAFLGVKLNKGNHKIEIKYEF